jgi:hypothetical protein
MDLMIPEKVNPKVTPIGGGAASKAAKYKGGLFSGQYMAISSDNRCS